MLPRLSIIVPAKNEELVVGKCIESLLNQDYPKNKLEIFVVSDGCKDRTVEIAKSYEPRVKVLNLKTKRCKAEALNAVWPKAKGEIIGIFDADCIADKNCLKNAANNFKDENIAAINGTIKSYNYKENLLTRSVALETCFVSFMEKFMNKHGANVHLLGKNMFIRKSVLEEVKGFDEFTYLEDAELSLKIKKKFYETNFKRYKVNFEPNAVVWQEEPASLGSFFRQRTRWARGSIRLFSKVKNESLKWNLSALLHGINYYISPFSLIFLTILSIFLYFRLHFVFTIPLFGLFVFLITLIVYSRIDMKEPLRDLIFLPIWFLLNNLYVLIIFPKALIEEVTGKNISWYKAHRMGFN